MSAPSDSNQPPEEASGGTDSGTDSGQGPGGGLGEGIGGWVPSLFDWLEWLLRPLLVLLIAGLLVGTGYRYRDRLVAAFGALFGGLVGASSGDRDGDQWDPGEPSNPVHAAWIELLQRTNLEDPHARTPEECRDAAIEAGLEPDAVRNLTREFRDVRYGDRPVTDDRVERARESLDRITDDGGTSGRRRNTLGRIEGGDSA